MDTEKIRGRLTGCQKLLIGLGEEWKWKRGDAAQEARLREAYEKLYDLVKDKDYFIITMATDALIFDTKLGSENETAVTERKFTMEEVSCPGCGRADPGNDGPPVSGEGKTDGQAGAA